VARRRRRRGHSLSLLLPEGWVPIADGLTLREARRRLPILRRLYRPRVGIDKRPWWDR
jgi:hypothetical protein